MRAFFFKKPLDFKLEEGPVPSRFEDSVIYSTGRNFAFEIAQSTDDAILASNVSGVEYGGCIHLTAPKFHGWIPKEYLQEFNYESKEDFLERAGVESEKLLVGKKIYLDETLLGFEPGKTGIHNRYNKVLASGTYTIKAISDVTDYRLHVTTDVRRAYGHVPFIAIRFVSAVSLVMSKALLMEGWRTCLRDAEGELLELYRDYSKLGPMPTDLMGQHFAKLLNLGLL